MVTDESALKGPESEEHVIFFNSQDVRSTGSIKDVHEHNGQNIWIDLVDPTLGQIQALRKFFPINESAMQRYNKSKKAQIHVFDDQKFMVLLAIGFENSHMLTVEPIYLFVGKGWLITIRSVAAIGTIEELYTLFEQKDKHLMASSVNGLYYSIIIGIVNSYEQMLTSMELTIASLGNNSLHKPSMKMLESLDTLSKQIIILRRHFWHTRHIVNLLLNSDAGGDENNDSDSSNGSGNKVKSLKVAYDEVNQFIDLIESLRDSINSTRDLYVANISLQLNDTMKTLTIFSSILLPLTFVASLYGMNGLDLNNIGAIPVGFVLVIASMAAVAGVLFVFFRRKQWILIAKEPAENSRAEPSKDKNEVKKSKE